MRAIWRQARSCSKMLVVGWVLLALISPGNVALADGPDKPGAGGKAAPTTELQDGTKGNAAHADAAAGETCAEDTGQADFHAGQADGLDLSTIPGSITLSRQESLDQAPSPYSGDHSHLFGLIQVAQSFAPSQTGRISRVSLSIRLDLRGDPAVPIVVELRGDDAGRPGALLATGAMSGQASRDFQVLTAQFGVPPEVVAGSTYYILLRTASCNCYQVRAGDQESYPYGTYWTSADGTTWRAAPYGPGDLVFQTYVLAYEGSGTFVSGVKDGNPAPGAATLWSSLTWMADMPPATGLKFQVAGADSLDGPFSFVGPDGTAGSFYTGAGGSLAQFGGDRYLRYKAYLTGDGRRTATVSAVRLCRQESAAGSSCPVDSTQAHFEAGTPSGLDLHTNPGSVSLPFREAPDQPATAYTGAEDRYRFGQNPIAQAFKPGQTGRLTRVTLAVRLELGGSAEQPVIVELRRDDGGRPGPVVAAATWSGEIAVHEFRALTAIFEDQPELLAGATYYISARTEDCTCYRIKGTEGNPYPAGTYWLSENGGATWGATPYGAGDLVFQTYLLAYQGSGTFVSAVKDSNPPAGTTPVWNLSWLAEVPTGTSLKFQVAGSDSPTGPFTFTGPDGTGGSFYTGSPAAARQLTGNRYLRYKVAFFSLNPARTPRLFGVLTCFTAPSNPLPPPCIDVSWANAARVFVSGNSIRKSYGSNAWDAGAVSQHAVTSGSARVEATVWSRTERFAFGLGKGDGNQGLADIDFALQTDPSTGKLGVLEGGVSKGTFGFYQPDDVLRVAVEFGVVRYYRNGGLLYTSALAPSYPLQLDSSLYNQGAQIFNARLCGSVITTAPNSGVNAPAQGTGRVDQGQQFVTTCSDPDGWRDISTIDFKVARRQGPAEEVVLWVQLDQNTGRFRFHDPDTGSWSEGAPGENRVLSSRYAELRLAGTRFRGRGPTNPAVDITWDVVFKQPAAGSYSQYLRIADDAGAATPLDEVGSWKIIGPGAGK